MKHFSVAMLALGIMVAAAPAARANTTCTGQLSNTTVNDNLIVPTSITCHLSGVTVTGNVQVQMNATLTIGSSTNTNGTTIDGNLRVGTGAALSMEAPLTVHGNVVADQCSAVILVFAAKVDGNVDIQNCTFPGNQFLFVSMGFVQIAGNVNCSNNSFPGCDLVSSTVKGNVQISNNGDNSNVEGNTIGGNLQCFGNGNISGGGNTVGGHKQGQCAGF